MGTGLAGQMGGWHLLSRLRSRLKMEIEGRMFVAMYESIHPLYVT